ncbi:hypothetical protein ACJ41O_009086 [Fusarium nematophilum]
MYANARLNFYEPWELELTGLPIVVGGGKVAGVYPSGGPCPHITDIWRLNAPALDVLAPDLCVHNCELICQYYTELGNPLFIPEQRLDGPGARRLWLALATYGALGTGPFGIDTGAEIIGRQYKLLSQTQSFLLATVPEDRFGFFFDEEPLPGAGMVIHLGMGRFLYVGRGFHISFESIHKEATFTGILRTEEKEVGENGQLHTLRALNGDETRSGAFVMMPNDDPDNGGFPIAVTIPARTCIAKVEAYWIRQDYKD